MKNYSRLASVEERKNIKRAYWYVGLSVVAVIFLIFLGLPTLVKFAGFIGEVGKSDNPVEINDNTPPAPPQFEDIPENTNEESLDIKGKSENAATITITANDETVEVVSNSDGDFNFVFNLNKGENTISAKAKDLSGNESTQTQTYTIFFDNEDPKLEISSPPDNSTFYGSGQRQLSIKGSVSEPVDLTINGRFVALKDDNTFSFVTSLSEGENKFEIKAIDASENEDSSSLTINFTP